jgi:signal transduction histidine kinase
METTLYRVIQEALTNVARHAQASQVRLHLQRRQSAVVALIQDDGQGFDVAHILDQEDLPSGTGLLGIRERVTLLGGKFNVRSRPGQGTQLTVEIPWENGR